MWQLRRFWLWFTIASRVSSGFLFQWNVNGTGVGNEVITCLERIAKDSFPRGENVLVISEVSSITGQILHRIEPHFGVNLATEYSKNNFQAINSYIVVSEGTKGPYEILESMNVNRGGRFVIVTKEKPTVLEVDAERFWKLGTANVIFVVPSNDETLTVFGYEISSEHLNPFRLRVLDHWKNRFVNRSNLFPNKFSDMRNYPLKVTVLNNEETITDVRVHNRNSKVTITGMGSNLLNLFAKKLNFTLVVSEKIARSYTWEDEMWANCIEELSRDAIDLSFAGILPTTRVFQKLDYSSFYRWASLHFVVKAAGRSVSWRIVFEPFSIELWICQIFVLVGILGFIRLVGKFRSMGIIEEYIKVIDVLRVLFYQNVQYPKSSSLRLGLALWLLYAFLILASYTSSLASFLTSPRLIRNPDTFKDLANLNLTIGGPESVKMFLNSTNDPVDQKINSRYFSMTYRESSSKMLENKIVTVRYLNSVVNHNWKYRMNESLQLHAVKEVISNYPFFYYMKKGHLFRVPLNNFLGLMHSSGLVEKWLEDHSLKKTSSKDQELVVLTLHHMGGVFLVLICGQVLSIAAFIFELYLPYL